MSEYHVEKSIQNGVAQSIFDRAMQIGTREAMAIAIYELKAEFGLDEQDIRGYVAENWKRVQHRRTSIDLIYKQNGIDP